MSRRENYIKVVTPKITERGIMSKHWPKNWDEEISFTHFALLRTIAALSVDAIWPPSSIEITQACVLTEGAVLVMIGRLISQGMLHPGSIERGCVLTPNGKRLVTDVTVYERYRPDAPRVPTS